MSPRRVLILTLTLALPLAGCSTLRTKSSDIVGYEDRNARIGQYYFLPRSIVTIQGQMVDKAGYTVSMTQALVPDKSHRYFVRWTPNLAYDDDLKGVNVDEDGLLSSVEVETTDQTPAILKDLTQTAVNLFTIAGHIPSRLRTDGQTETRKPFKVSFDPSDDQAVTAAKNLLQAQQSIDLQVSLKHFPRYADRKYVWPKTKFEDDGRVLPQDGGLFYHPPTVADLKLVDSWDKNLGTNTAEVALRVPDKDHLACVRFGRGFMVKRATKMVFAKGMPKELTNTQPSQLRALTNTVQEVTKIVADGIPAIVNVKQNQAAAGYSAEKGALDAQAQYVKAQQDLLTNQANLQKLQTEQAAAVNANRSADDANTEQKEKALRKTLDEQTKMRTTFEKRAEQLKKVLEDKGIPIPPPPAAPATPENP